MSYCHTYRFCKLGSNGCAERDVMSNAPPTSLLLGLRLSRNASSATRGGGGGGTETTNDDGVMSNDNSAI